MTHKDYIRIAEALRQARVDIAGTISEPGMKDAHQAWRLTCLNVASTLQADNPRFDRDRFLNACHPISSE